LTDIDTTVDGRPIGIIPIHFDVPVHHIPWATYEETANKTRAIIDAFNHELYDGQVEYDFLVFPHEEGSFLAKFGIAVVVGGAIWHFAETGMGKAFIKGLTNHPPEYWAEAAGSYVQKKVLSAVSTADAALRTSASPLVRCQFENIIITESTKSFLQTDQTQLNRVGVTTRKFRDAYDARNRFYQGCAADQKVKGLGFDETDEFPIKRKDFSQLQVALLPREEQPEVKRWQVQILTLDVTSPNWDETDRKRRWKGRDEERHECLFEIEDEQFWRLVQTRQIDPRIIDTMKVQMAFIGPQRREARVLRVLEYNDKVLGEPLDDNALDAILGSFNAPPKDDSGDLFRK
jgi:hypothetical protein